jgi:transposase-like protein
VGSVWVADETVLNLDNRQKVWFWDIIDAKIRFLIATHISRTRTIKDAQKLMEKAICVLVKSPVSFTRISYGRI